MAWVDGGAAHNFISTRKTVRLGLKLTKDYSKLKAVNSQAKEMHGKERDDSDGELERYDRLP